MYVRAICKLSVDRRISKQSMYFAFSEMEIEMQRLQTQDVFRNADIWLLFSFLQFRSTQHVVAIILILIQEVHSLSTSIRIYLGTDFNIICCLKTYLIYV